MINLADYEVAVQLLPSPHLMWTGILSTSLVSSAVRLIHTGRCKDLQQLHC